MLFPRRNKENLIISVYKHAKVWYTVFVCFSFMEDNFCTRRYTVIIALEEAKLELNNFRDQIKELGNALRIDSLREQANTLEE